MAITLAPNDLETPNLQGSFFRCFPRNPKSLVNKSYDKDSPRRFGGGLNKPALLAWGCLDGLWVGQGQA